MSCPIGSAGAACPRIQRATRLRSSARSRSAGRTHTCFRGPLAARSGSRRCSTISPAPLHRDGAEPVVRFVNHAARQRQRPAARRDRRTQAVRFVVSSAADKSHHLENRPRLERHRHAQIEARHRIVALPSAACSDRKSDSSPARESRRYKGSSRWRCRCAHASPHARLRVPAPPHTACARRSSASDRTACGAGVHARIDPAPLHVHHQTFGTRVAFERTLSSARSTPAAPSSPL